MAGGVLHASSTHPALTTCRVSSEASPPAAAEGQRENKGPAWACLGLPGPAWASWGFLGKISKASQMSQILISETSPYSLFGL